MLAKIFKGIVGSKNDRELKKLNPYVDQINGLEPGIHALPDGALWVIEDGAEGRLIRLTPKD